LLSRGLSLLQPSIFDDPCSSTKSKIDFQRRFFRHLSYQSTMTVTNLFCLFRFSPVSLHSSQSHWFIGLVYRDAIVEGTEVCQRAGCTIGKAEPGDTLSRKLVVFMCVSSLSLIDARKTVPSPVRG
jgi:hypothetical protein